MFGLEAIFQQAENLENALAKLRKATISFIVCLSLLSFRIARLGFHSTDFR
jgi:hypothetical protein